jgi:LemA protein
MKITTIVSLVLTTLALSGCGYNTLQRRDEQVKEAWAQVLTNYQKRHDLVPNLVATVQGYASHEKEVLTRVTAARASVASPLPANATPEQMEAFVAKQGELTSAMSRLLVVVENYPQLKADTNFLRLQEEIVKIENQLVASRNRYTREVRDYNTVVRSFPTNLTANLFGNSLKPQLEVEDEKAIRASPQVKFN